VAILKPLGDIESGRRRRSMLSQGYPIVFGRDGDLVVVHE